VKGLYLERVYDMLYLFLTVIRIHYAEDVKTYRNLFALLLHVKQRQVSQFQSFPAMHRFEGIAEGIVCPCFDFNENSGITIPGDDIYLADIILVVLSNDFITLFLKEYYGEVFAFIAKRFHCLRAF
jgi:hypothetical protein